MLLFHGTLGEHIEKIFVEGLRPPQPDGEYHDWVKPLTGHTRLGSVFLSTSPVAGKGGDPVSFALGWPLKHLRLADNRDGYIVVVDLPQEAQKLIRAAVPNIELDNFIESVKVREFFLRKEELRHGNTEQPVIKLSNWCLFYWLTRYLKDTGIDFVSKEVQSMLYCQDWCRHEALSSDLTAEQWRTFLDDYFHFMDYKRFDIKDHSERDRKRRALLQRYAIKLPDYIEEDYHDIQCRLCIEPLFISSYSIKGFEQYLPFRQFINTVRRRGWKSPLASVDTIKAYGLLSYPNRYILDNLAFLLRLVDMHVASHSQQEIERFFELHEEQPQKRAWTWKQWYLTFPVDVESLPAVWRPNYGKVFDEQMLHSSDCQVMTGPIPVQYIVGAIRISDGQKLLPHIRPQKNRGETLNTLLLQRAHALKASYNGVPLIC